MLKMTINDENAINVYNELWTGLVTLYLVLALQPWQGLILTCFFKLQFFETIIPPYDDHHDDNQVTSARHPGHLLGAGGQGAWLLHLSEMPGFSSSSSSWWCSWWCSCWWSCWWWSYSPSFCHHGTYQQVDNNLDSEKSTQMTNHHNSRPATGHALIIPIMILIIIWQIILRIIIPMIISMIILINILLLISKDNSNDNNSNGNNSNYNCRLAIGNTLKRRRTVRLQMTQPSRIPSFPWRPRSDYFQFMIDYLEWIICSIIFRPKDFMRISWIFWMIFPSQGLYQNFLNELSFEWFFPPLVFMQLFEYLCNYLNIYAIIWIFMQLFELSFERFSPPTKVFMQEIMTDGMAFCSLM